MQVKPVTHAANHCRPSPCRWDDAVPLRDVEARPEGIRELGKTGTRQRVVDEYDGVNKKTPAQGQ